MWNRPALLLWFSLHIKGRHNFHLVLPIPLFLLLMLTDILEDLSALTPLFWHKSHYRNWRSLELSPAIFMSLASVCSGLSREIVLHAQPLDLLDVDVTDNENHVRVKCLLR